MSSSGGVSAKRRCVVCHASYERGERFCSLDGGAVVADGETTEDALIGRTIDDRYFVRRLLGRGGMGAVYEADHVGLDKRVAIKFVSHDDADRDIRARFRQEARAASKVVHEHVVQIFDVGVDEGRDFIVMELVEGKDLRELLREQTTLPYQRAVSIARQMLRGLQAIHDAGIVHRDIKPANILLTDRRADFVKIMDFGIAKSVGGTVAQTDTGTGRVIGTPQYMAPEQLVAGDIDHRADFYAVGVTLYAMITGEVPFTGTSASKMGDVLNVDAPRLDTNRPGIPANLASAVERALAKDPADRFATADEFIAALGDDATPAPTAKPEAATKPMRSSRPEPTTPTPEERRKARVPWLVIGGLAVAVFAGTAFYLLRSPAKTSMPADAAPVATPVAPPDPLEVARAAEAKGEFARAIAAYEEVYAAHPGPDPLYRIADLYERLGAPARAVTYFQMYLDARRDAPDRDQVLARIERLTAESAVEAPADAAVPDAAATAAKRIASPEPAKRAPQPDDLECACSVEIDGLEAAVCDSRLSVTRCDCISEERGGMCQVPWQPDESGTLHCRSDRVGCAVKDLDDPAPCNERYAANQLHHGACTGFVANASPNRVNGTWDCTYCGSARPFRGKLGEPCKGFVAETGKPVIGTLVKCARPRRPF